MATKKHTTVATEEWRPVAGWPYEVSSFGRVKRMPQPERGLHQEKMCGGSVVWPGYRKVSLIRVVSGAIQRWYPGAHQLVCAAWHGPKPSPNHQVAHWDGVGLNNTPSNLRWATVVENSMDRWRHGTMNNKLNEAMVREIRQLANTYSEIHLAREYRVSKALIHRVITRQAWKHVV